MILYLIDGYGFVFRAYHSLPPLTRADGTPIGAVLGFTNMLLKFLAAHEADYMAVALDAGRKTFRHDIYPEYKANRDAPPEDLVAQFPVIREVVEAFNIPILEKEGYEADDLIATLAKKAADSGMEVRIISSDKDLMQLISDKISMYDAMRDRTIEAPQVFDKFGVQPNQVLDVLSLIGDSSDNIPGVKGIGQKTAAELINQFGSLDNVYANLDKIAQKRRKELLEQDKENAYLSKKLVSLDYDVPIDSSLDLLKVREPEPEKLLKFLQEQGFHSLLKKLALKPQAVVHKTQINAVKIDNLTEFKKHFAAIIESGMVGLLFTEKTIEIAYENTLLELELKQQVQGGLFDEPIGMLRSDFFRAFKEILEADYVKKVVIDAKNILKDYDMAAYDDVALMSYSTDTGRHNYDIKTLVKVYLDDEEINATQLLKLHAHLSATLFTNKQVTLYETIDKPMAKVLADIEKRGVKIDAPLLKSLSDEYKAYVKNLQEQIFLLAGKEFNIGSPKQLGQVLFEDLKIPTGKKSKLGAYPTGAEVLEQLKDQGYPIAAPLLEWRQFSKLISTYLDALPKSINPKTGRVHTTFMMTGTLTGRLSSTDPNLQNIPIRTDYGHKIREAFIAESGNVIISADYSQIELRLLADLANIETLKTAFRNKQDIHAITASQMFGMPVDQVDTNTRRKAKTINFGIIYGISAFGLASRLDIPRNQAKDYIEKYFAQYPGIKEYMSNSIAFAKEHGYVKTLLGRKCYINQIHDKNFAVRGVGERAAINAPLQGTAADIIKKAMVSLPDAIKRYMVLQIHDELLFELPETEVDSAIKIIKKTMENAAHLSVPLPVDIKVGKNWALAHGIGK
ncbi:MAG: DNA polymerase I [Rickettsiales bacterium]